MGKGVSPGTEPLPAGGAYIVVAALNGKDDKPDLDTVRAFLVTPAQGVSYHPGIWREWCGAASRDQSGLVDGRADKGDRRPFHADCRCAYGLCLRRGGQSGSLAASIR